MDSQNNESFGYNSDEKEQHSFEQVIEKLEEVFSKMPNPENQVMEQLSEELGLDITQVKIWFDNKRCCIQVQRDKEEQETILLEKERLYSENLQMCSELKKRFCAICQNPEKQETILQDLRDENAKLREDVTRISNLVDRLKEDPEGYLQLLQQAYLINYNDPNGLDLELRLGSNDDPMA